MCSVKWQSIPFLPLLKHGGSDHEGHRGGGKGGKRKTKGKQGLYRGYWLPEVGTSGSQGWLLCAPPLCGINVLLSSCPSNTEITLDCLGGSKKSQGPLKVEKGGRRRQSDGVVSVQELQQASSEVERRQHRTTGSYGMETVKVRPRHSWTRQTKLLYWNSTQASKPGPKEASTDQKRPGFFRKGSRGFHWFFFLRVSWS